MKNYIEALIAREKTRYDQAIKEQNQVNSQLTHLRNRNRVLTDEAMGHKDKIDFLNRMLEEETENA